MFIYDTLSGKKKKLTKPRGERPLRLFVCGPTVYDAPHMGHARTYVAFDAVVRFLRSRGFNIFFLENITNVDDKIIVRARERKTDPFTLALQYENEFHTAMRAFGVGTVDLYARASEFIPAIIEQIESLVRRGYAYRIPDNGYYFDIAKFKDYGKLSHRTALQAEDSVSRIDDGLGKRNKGDFCLWKFVENTDYTDKKRITRMKKKGEYMLVNGEPAWKTSLGWGRPGWHIEDTAITETFFGPQYEIHGGGLDLKFPHHEAEIAEQEAVSGKQPLVRFWMHTGQLLINNKKMSKSLKNFITTEEYLSAYGMPPTRAAAVFRLIVLQHHYRSPMNFTEELVAQTNTAYGTIVSFLARLAFVEKKGTPSGARKITLTERKAIEKTFIREMEEDLNTPKAIGVLFSYMSDLQKDIWKLGVKDAEAIRGLFTSLFATLGLFFDNKPALPVVYKISRERELCRKHAQFVQADALREKLNTLGYEIEDTPLGPFLSKKA